MDITSKPGSTIKNKTGGWRTYKPVTDYDKCIGCGRCAQVCPESCIAMYDENGVAHHIHDLKLDTLRELQDENPDSNLLVAYNYKHELARLTKAFPDAVVMDKKGVALAEWNKGNIKMLLVHPKSASHGLNLQDGGDTAVWFSLTWSLEEYLQFNARLYRQGQKSDKVRVFHIAVGEIEERLMRVLSQKNATQRDLLEALK